MKWIDSEKNLKDDQVDKEEWKHYKVYQNQAAIEADVHDPKKFSVWAQFPQTDNQKIHRKSQRKYEIYVGGFLFYHDEVFKRYSNLAEYTNLPGYPDLKVYPDWRDYLKSHPDLYDTGGTYFEHHIYIEWDKKNGYVTIYINNTPDDYNVNPPPPPKPPPPES